MSLGDNDWSLHGLHAYILLALRFPLRAHICLSVYSTIIFYLRPFTQMFFKNSKLCQIVTVHLPSYPILCHILAVFSYSLYAIYPFQAINFQPYHMWLTSWLLLFNFIWLKKQNLLQFSWVCLPTYLLLILSKTLYDKPHENFIRS